MHRCLTHSDFQHLCDYLVDLLPILDPFLELRHIRFVDSLRYGAPLQTMVPSIVRAVAFLIVDCTGAGWASAPCV